MYNMFDIGQKSTFLRKGPKNLTPPPPTYSITFLSFYKCFASK